MIERGIRLSSKERGIHFMKGQTNVILTIILIIVIAVFAITNIAPVEVNYLFWKAESPLILIILFSVLMGGLIMGAVGTIRIMHLKRENKQMKIFIKNKGLENEFGKKVNNDKSQRNKKD